MSSASDKYHYTYINYHFTTITPIRFPHNPELWSAGKVSQNNPERPFSLDKINMSDKNRPNYIAS